MDTKTVIYFVGATLLLAVAGIVALAVTGTGPVPDVLQNIAVGCLTGLVGLLVPSRDTVNRRRVPVGKGEGGDAPGPYDDHGRVDGSLVVAVMVGVVLAWLVVEILQLLLARA